MTLAGLSGSTAARHDACPPSAHLPQSDSVSDAGVKGTDVHAYLAIVAMSPASKSVALEAAPKALRPMLAAIDLPVILDGASGLVTEPAYAYDVATGKVRYLGRDLARKYGALGENEIATTLDVIGRVPERDVEGDKAFVRDWKTGQDCGDPADSWQLALQALCARAHLGVDEVDAGYVYLDDEGDHRIAAVTWDALDLDEWADKFRDLVARVRAAKASDPVTEGSHCTYCPALPYCPAKAAYVAALVTRTEDERAAALGAIDEMTLETAARALVALKAAAKWVERAEDALGQRLRAGGDEGTLLPDGRRLRMVEKGGTYLDQAGAKALAVSLGATPDQMAALVKQKRPWWEASITKDKPAPKAKASKALPAAKTYPALVGDDDAWEAGRM